MAKARESEELTKEQRKAILDERAAFLAQAPLTSGSQKENQLDVLELIISDEKFAIEARHVREASKLSTWTPLPCTPDFVLGLMNFRGQILPLLDLRKILELKPRIKGTDLQVVVVQTSLGQAGIAVDEITGISSIAETDLQSAKLLVSPQMAPLLRGMRNDRLALLDIEKIFMDPRLIVESNP